MKVKGQEVKVVGKGAKFWAKKFEAVKAVQAQVAFAKVAVA